jgi:hypothetical protein
MHGKTTLETKTSPIYYDVSLRLEEPATKSASPDWLLRLCNRFCVGYIAMMQAVINFLDISTAQMIARLYCSCPILSMDQYSDGS